MLPSSPRHPTSTITGILVPVAWASSGKIICLAVATFDEKEFWVADDESVGQYQKWLNQMVSVQGVAYEQDGRQWFRIHSFQRSELEIHNPSTGI